MENLKYDELSYSEFWKEKELEFNSKLILPSYSVLHTPLRENKKLITGILYLMTDGFHFEEFHHTSPIFDLIKPFIKQKNTQHDRIKLTIEKENIDNITDKNYMIPTRKNKNVLKKILSSFLKHKYFIIIHTIESINNQNELLFENLVKNYIWLEKFNQIKNNPNNRKRD